MGVPLRLYELSTGWKGPPAGDRVPWSLQQQDHFLNRCVVMSESSPCPLAGCLGALAAHQCSLLEIEMFDHGLDGDAGDFFLSP